MIPVSLVKFLILNKKIIFSRQQQETGPAPVAGRRWKCSYNIENLITLDIRRREERGESASPVTSSDQAAAEYQYKDER